MKKLIIPALAFLLPVVTFAQDLGNLQDLAEGLQDLINLLIPIAIGLAVLAFFWGVALFIFKAGDEDAKERGRRIMVGGIIGLFVILAIWGILAFIFDALGLKGNVGGNIQDIPTIDDLN